jgi:hypothetical protein
MNFANVDGFGRYHQPTDTVANADAATVQHHGSYALALTRAFADREVLVPPATGDQVYFTAGTVFVHYAAREATTLAGLAAGLLGIVLAVGAWRRRLPVGAVLAGSWRPRWWRRACGGRRTVRARARWRRSRCAMP